MLRKMRQVLKIEQKWLRKVVKEFEFTRMEFRWKDWVNSTKLDKFLNNKRK